MNMKGSNMCTVQVSEAEENDTDEFRSREYNISYVIYNNWVQSENRRLILAAMVYFIWYISSDWI